MISLVIHSVALIGIGWIAARTFTVYDNIEQYVELELINDLAAMGGERIDFPADKPYVNGRTAAAVSDVSSVHREQAPVATITGSMSMLPAEAGSTLSGIGASGNEGGALTSGGNGASYGTGGGTVSSSGTGKPGESRDIISPKILSRVEPSYPERARQAGWQGMVVLKIEIMENGCPGDVIVYQTSGWDLLDDAAVDAIKRWRFIPAKERESGRAVKCYITMPIVFRIKS